MTARVTWRGITIEIRHTPNWLKTGFDQIEVEAVPRAPLPITATGYRSLFLEPGDLDAYDDATDFLRQWLDRAAKDWDGQMELF